MILNEQIDFFSEIFSTSKRSSLKRLPGDYAKPGLHLIQSRRISWDEMDMVPGFPRKPGSNLLMLLGCIVVHNDMDIQFWRHVCVNVSRKLQALLMAVSFLRLGHNACAGNIQRSKKDQRSMTDVIMDVALSVTKAKWKGRLRAFKGLALAFLVHAKHQSVFRTVQIRPGNITDLFHEKRIGRKLESVSDAA